MFCFISISPRRRPRRRRQDRITPRKGQGPGIVGGSSGRASGFAEARDGNEEENAGAIFEISGKTLFCRQEDGLDQDQESRLRPPLHRLKAMAAQIETVRHGLRQRNSTSGTRVGDREGGMKNFGPLWVQ